MTEDTTHANLESSSPDLHPAKVIFSLDPKTLLFQTHKSEDVSILQNRVSLIEIHEVLMEINLNLIPRVKVIQRAYAWYLGGLAVSSLLVLIMLLMQNIKLLMPIACIFVAMNLWYLGIAIGRKHVYDRVIKRVLKSKEDLFNSSGLNWVLKNSYFSFSKKSSCWLELHRNTVLDFDTERIPDLQNEKNENAHENENENAQKEKYASIYQQQKVPGSARRLQVGSNFTLGPGMGNPFSFYNTPRYTAIDVGRVESNRVRKPSH